jgi:hypothetical protein
VPLNLDYAVVQGNVNAAKLAVNGKTTMKGARISGSLNLKGALMGSRVDCHSLTADGMVVGGELDATEMHAVGTVGLLDVCATFVSFRSACVEARNLALHLDRLRVAGSVYFDNDARFSGGVRAIGLRAGGSVYFDGTHLAVPREMSTASVPKALVLDRSDVSGDLRFGSASGNAFRADGGMDMVGIQVG